VNSIIGQFGVGFYSCFMVSDKVEVYSRPSGEGSKGHCWTTDGSGSYEIREADGVNPGTKIVLHLKQDCAEFSDEDRIRNVITKYSNFIGSSIYLNGKKANTIQALWLMDPKEVTETMHDEFYRFVSASFDRPRFTLHYNTDAPLNIRCLLYVPEGKPGLFDLQREGESSLSLYTRKVLIKSKADNLLPKWLRFVKGVVDSEDIPLNLSRELLQESSLIRKLKTVLTNRLLRFLYDQARKDPENYDKFFKDYGVFLKEGILISTDRNEKEEIAKLLRYESSSKPAGEKVSLMDYCSRMKEGQKDVFYLAAPSRELAETSPYFEALKQKDVEVLFCFEAYDEIVFIQLQEFNRSRLTSVEKEMRQDKEEVKLDNLEEGSLSKDSVESLTSYIKSTLGQKVQEVKVTQRLSTHPCVVTVEEMGAARHFVRTQFQNIPAEQRYNILMPTLEINPTHPIIKKLGELQTSNPELGRLLTEQVFDNAMVAAGLVDDPRSMVTRLNQLLTLMVEKH
jgi:TNF receptor-associated protein 1